MSRDLLSPLQVSGRNNTNFLGETIQILQEQEIIAFKELRKTLWTIYLPGNV